MSTITLTPDELHQLKAQLPTVGPIYLTVEGDRERCGKCEIVFDYYCPDCRIVAPSRFVEATGPCETCDGKGYIWRRNDHGNWSEPCPSCEGTGIKQVELRVTCPECDALYLGPMENAKCVDGLLVFAHCSAEVLPVFAWNDGRERPQRYAWLPGDDTTQIRNPGSEPIFAPLTLDPLPRPGRDWIVVLDGLVLA